jgi:hypothetical protein
MKKTAGITFMALMMLMVTGCTGSTYNKERNCDYDYFLHPAISISKLINGCGPAEK